MRSVTKRPGRPPSYDRDKALGAITDLFWTHGFAATSLDGIAKATGMSRPSLYAAFGDKREMYLLALRSFADSALRGMADALSRPKLKDALSAFFDQAIDCYTTGLSARGCFIACSGVHEAANDDGVHASVSLAFSDIDALLEDRLRRAEEGGELPIDFTIENGVRLVSCILHSIAVRARAGASHAELRALATTAIHVMSIDRPN